MLSSCTNGDVHYINKENKIFLEVYITSNEIGHKPHPLCTNPRENALNYVYHLSGDKYYIWHSQTSLEADYLKIWGLNFSKKAPHKAFSLFINFGILVCFPFW